MKLNRKWLTAIYIVATILIIIGITLRLTEQGNGFIVGFIGITIGIIALIANGMVPKIKK
ncbi:hypothetical protein [Brumimicrobium mesophilum]|uniref:hypothetical protein n=1 Tax=Brumimicrobium mesophilum TaxID=392717 RepID=UPI000D144356|nr:hypothetical protein [Brumimicrobium mesophilum]